MQSREDVSWVASIGSVLLNLLAAQAGMDPDGGVQLLVVPPLHAVGTIRGGYAPFIAGGYALRVSGQGYVYEGPRFDAQVGPDGSVSFRDKRGSTELVPFAWIAESRAQVPTSVHPPSMRGLEEQSAAHSPWVPPTEQTRPLPRTPDERDLCPWPTACWTPIPIDRNLVSATQRDDLTDELMHQLGRDPYAREKADFLSATYPFRVQLASDANQGLLKETLDFFPQRLEALWADTRYSPRERRRILYDLWYQTDSTPAGRHAAEMIGAFIERQLACGSADAYTPEELQAFRARHPERPFLPGEVCASRPSNAHRR